MTILDPNRRAYALARRRSLLCTVAAVLVLGLLGQGTRVLAAPGGLKTVLIPIEGMACVACAASVKRALKALDGVSEVEVNLERRSATVKYADDKVTPERLVAAINKLGYRAGAPKEVE